MHTTYFNIRRRAQKLAKRRPKTARRLLRKYSGRERRKARDLCHRISRAIVDFAKRHGFGIIMEDLKGIRERIRYGRKLNRRLQFCVEYKAKLACRSCTSMRGVLRACARRVVED